MKCKNLNFLRPEVWMKLGLALFFPQLIAAAAPDYFKLEPGGVWIYRAEDGSDTFTMRMSNAGLAHSGHFHYRLNGYAATPLYVYRNESDGMLYALNSDDDSDVLLTSIEHVPGSWFNAPYRACEHEGQVQAERQPYQGPSGVFARALSIQYRSFGCPDTGILEERFVENIGMVTRIVQTLKGPVSYHLAHANAGTVTISESPGAAFRIVLRRVQDRLLADLQLVAAGSPVTLQFPTSQEYDVQLRGPDGMVIWRWGADKFFTLTEVKRTSASLVREVEIPLSPDGAGLPDGVYTVEAWLTTVPERQFAASVNYFHVNPAQSESQ